MRYERTRNRAGRGPESYPMSKITLDASLEERTKSINSNKNDNKIDKRNKRATMGRPKILKSFGEKVKCHQPLYLQWGLRSGENPHLIL
jgi:hypothetical protein